LYFKINCWLSRCKERGCT